MDRLFSPSLYAHKASASNFIYTLHRSRWQLASDPRDHVYALLGHPTLPVLDDGSGERLIEADYTKPVEKVYHDLAASMLLHSKGPHALMMLNVVQHNSVEAANVVYMRVGHLSE